MDQILFQNRFLALIDRDGYSFVREVRCDGVIVSVLPFRTKDGAIEFLARLEVCPAHGHDLRRCSITGGVENNETIEDTVLEELKEEAGFLVDRTELVSLGQVRPSKSSDTVAHLFAVDVTDKPQFAIEGDGSSFESTSSAEWVNYDAGVQIQDALFLSALLRLEARRNYGTSRNKSKET